MTVEPSVFGPLSHHAPGAQLAAGGSAPLRHTLAMERVVAHAVDFGHARLAGPKRDLPRWRSALRRWQSALGATAAVAFLVSACAAPVDQPPTTPDSAISLTDAADAAWAQVSAQYPDAVRPEADLVRTVAPPEWATAIAECLNAEGFGAIAQADGSVYFDTGEQDEAYSVALYTCKIRYPIDPKFQGPLNDEQLRRVYEYSKTTLAPCLESFGIAVPEPPSLELFLEKRGNPEAWNIYGDVHNILKSNAQWQEINATCPQYPSDIYE